MKGKELGQKGNNGIKVLEANKVSKDHVSWKD